VDISLWFTRGFASILYQPDVLCIRQTNSVPPNLILYQPDIFCISNGGGGRGLGSKRGRIWGLWGAGDASL
jgi:hypothetical protein